MMSFLDWLLRRKPKGRSRGAKLRGSETEHGKATNAAIKQVAAGEGSAAGRFPRLADAAPELLTRTARSATVAKGGPAPSLSIWDVEADTEAARAPTPSHQAPTHQTAPNCSQVSATPRRSTRTRTRVLGFEAQPAAVVPLFDEGRMGDVGLPGKKSNVVMYPTGWLVVTKGVGRGAAFALAQGVSQIGRGSDQTIALDFGDMAISRQNHAAIAYDGATHQFHIGHGGKSNLVRLNGKPLLSTEALNDGDEIQIGETTLLLKVLCTPAFNWSASEAGGDGHDVAIA
jgi:hypothetical protein